MRYPAEHKEQTRQRIVRSAAGRFRRRGAEGAAIAELMRDLGLTHGGFYRHFSSKDELFAEAFARGLLEFRERLARAVERAPTGEELPAIIDAYLDPAHCADVAGGCPIAALAPEIARRPRPARTALERLLADHIRIVAAYVPGATQGERERRAVLLLSGMAGTLALARVLTDDQRRRALLGGARNFYLAAATR